MATTLQPKPRILKILYLKGNILKRPLSAYELSKDISLHDYEGRERRIRNLLFSYYNQGLVSRVKIDGEYFYKLTEKGIKRHEYFQKKLLEDSSFLRRTNRNYEIASRHVIDMIKRKANR